MVSIIIKAPVIVVVSRVDQAGMNMRRRLFEHYSFSEIDFSVPGTWPAGVYELHQANDFSILTIPERQIYSDYLGGYLEANLLIFASKHSSAAGKKSLLVHTTGIWGKEAGHGGKDHELSLMPAYLITRAYELIKELKVKRSLDDYWVGVECTHHGPSSLTIPLLFVETGGTEEEWTDQNACNLIADVIKELLVLCRNEIPVDDKPALIGLGGGHYCPSFIKKLDSGEYLLGHVAPKYSHEYVNEKMMQQAYEKTIAKEKKFLIDKKGSKSIFRKKFIEIIEKNNWSWEFT
ncbi:MAG: D-aminoacyl-tRNA deacylase [Candidatus Kariarchaeaceae archaeon]|jgi:D-aminoacyl-tRNA deacylase